MPLHFIVFLCLAIFFVFCEVSHVHLVAHNERHNFVLFSCVCNIPVSDKIGGTISVSDNISGTIWVFDKKSYSFAGTVFVTLCLFALSQFKLSTKANSKHNQNDNDRRLRYGEPTEESEPIYCK